MNRVRCVLILTDAFDVNKCGKTLCRLIPTSITESRQYGIKNKLIGIGVSTSWVIKGVVITY